MYREGGTNNFHLTWWTLDDSKYLLSQWASKFSHCLNKVMKEALDLQHHPFAACGLRV